jgi:signal transduction histidine kinase
MEGGLAGPLTDKAGALVKIARIESDRLIRLINDILDLRKMEAGKLELKYDTVAVSPLIDRAIKAMKGMADSAQVSLESDTCDGSIWCDQDRMLQVLENVLSNAIKFSPTNSVVKLSAAENGNFIKFSVKDNGCGIAKDQIHKLFTKFQQLDSSDARPKGGTGLGLAISKEIVERHHGKIGIESEPGTGSLFWIELPAQTGVAQPQYISAATTLCERGDRSDTKCVLES